MAQFKRTNLVGERVLVSGTDVNGFLGSVVLDARQWNELNGHGEFDKAAAAFDQAVDEFFAPITKAAEAVEAAASKPGDDPVTYLVVNEGVAPTKGEERIVALLNHDSQVLRVLDEGQEDRLVWVNDSLEIQAAAAGFPAGSTPTPSAASSTPVSDSNLPSASDMGQPNFD